jgi:hypothetical protein
MREMKRILIILLLTIAAMGFVSAANGDCVLSASLLNQDPIHAVPGEYVKLVFQLNGVSDPSCGTVNFKLLQDYPFSLDPTVSDTKTIQSGTFTSQYSSQATIPYTVRVDKDALDNNYTLRVSYDSTASGAVIEKNFSISVEDVKSAFDVFVSDYAPATSTITFDILNTGKNNVDALTLEVLKQDSIILKGSNRAVVGALDTGQDTTVSYEATPSQTPIVINLSYNDQNGERRSLIQNVSFDASYFANRAADQKTTSPWVYVFYVVVVILVAWFIKRKFFKKKDKESKK